MPISPSGHKIKAPPGVLTSERNPKCEADRLRCVFCDFKDDSGSEFVHHMKATHPDKDEVEMMSELKRVAGLSIELGLSSLESSGQETSAHERPGQPDAKGGSHTPLPPGDPCKLKSESELSDHMEKAYSTEDLDSKVSEESQCYSEHDPVLPDQLWTKDT